MIICPLQTSIKLSILILQFLFAKLTCLIYSVYLKINYIPIYFKDRIIQTGQLNTLDSSGCPFKSYYLSQSQHPSSLNLHSFSFFNYIQKKKRKNKFKLYYIKLSGTKFSLFGNLLVFLLFSTYMHNRLRVQQQSKITLR